MISCGSLAAGDERAVEVSRGVLPEHILRILATLRYQIRMASSSITVVDGIQSVNSGQEAEMRTT